MDKTKRLKHPYLWLQSVVSLTSFPGLNLLSLEQENVTGTQSIYQETLI